MSDTEDVLGALFAPFASAQLPWPAHDRVLFLNARAGSWLADRSRANVLCTQTFKPFADELTHAHAALAEADALKSAAAVLVLPTRQREESRALLARALRAAAADGIVVASARNNAGARSAQDDLQRLVGPVSSASRRKCRVFWTSLRDAIIDWELVNEWAAFDQPQPIAHGRFVSLPGLFAWNRIDAASALLAAAWPADLAGRCADLGAGYGYLSSEIVRRCPRISAIDLYEADARALLPARVNIANATRLASRTIRSDFLWHDVTRGLERRYDVIVSNPPFHQGRADEPELGQAFIIAASNALGPGGRFWLVANRHLPYETVIARHFQSVRSVLVADGFKIVEAIK